MLLHGWTVTADLNFFTCYRSLAKRYRVLAMDHRGHGHGIRSWKPFRLEDCADDAAALLSELGIQEAVAVGYSMGGPVAQLLWRRHPSKVSGLVLCSTAARFTRNDLGSQIYLASLLGLSVMARLTPPGLRRSVAQNLIRRRIEEVPMADWVAHELGRSDPTAVLEAGVAVRAFDATSWVGSIDVPTAVVITTEDLVVSPRRQHRMAELIPGASVHLVLGDHGVCVNNPRAFNPVLGEALSSVVDRAADLAVAP